MEISNAEIAIIKECVDFRLDAVRKDGAPENVIKSLKSLAERLQDDLYTSAGGTHETLKDNLPPIEI